MPARTLLSTFFSTVLAIAFVGYLWHMNAPATDLSGLPTTTPPLTVPVATSSATSTATSSTTAASSTQ